MLKKLLGKNKKNGDKPDVHPGGRTPPVMVNDSNSPNVSVLDDSSKEALNGALDLDALANWLKEKEAQFLSKHNLQQEFNDYVLQIKKIAWRVNNRVNQWIDNIDLSKLKITSVGELNSLFSDAQTLVKLLNTPKEITLKNVSLFNKMLQEKTILVEERIENSALREELIHISQQEKENNPRNNLGNNPGNSLGNNLGNNEENYLESNPGNNEENSIINYSRFYTGSNSRNNGRHIHC